MSEDYKCFAEDCSRRVRNRTGYCSSECKYPDDDIGPGKHDCSKADAEEDLRT